MTLVIQILICLVMLFSVVAMAQEDEPVNILSLALLTMVSMASLVTTVVGVQ